MVRAETCGTKRGEGTENPHVNPPNARQREKLAHPPNNNMQNATTAAEKKQALIAARDARIEAERKRAEEEKVRAEAEAEELAELEKMEEEEKAKAEAERKAREEEEKAKAEEEAKKIAEEEKRKAEMEAMRLVTPADEEALLEVLRMQGVESPVLRAGPSTEGAEPCWACRKRDKECEWREHKRQVKIDLMTIKNKLTKKIIGRAGDATTLKESAR